MTEAASSDTDIADSIAEAWKVKALSQLDAALSRATEARRVWRSSADVAAVEAICMSAIRSVAPIGSPHRERAEYVWDKYAGAGVNENMSGEKEAHLTAVTQVLIGTVEALRHDVKAGYLTEVGALVRRQTFRSMLGLADQLLSAELKHREKDPAAVIVGVVLEEHLRKLASLNRIPTKEEGGSRRKADALNADLAKSKAYDQLEAKNITSWLQIRNDAVHADWDKFDVDHVDLMLQGVRSFVSRYPA